MDKEDIVRCDFPGSPDGYDRRSVEAHLSAVAAHVDALNARIEALGIEIEAIRTDHAAEAPELSPISAPPDPATKVRPAAESGAVDPGLSDDSVSARLVASKLFLDGTDRDAIVDRLSSEYRLDDPGALVDEVIEGLS